MISFSKLGNYGRLGNQLFQYAFLRTHARTLNTYFWCPKWDGDVVFDLLDEGERASVPDSPTMHYSQGDEAGYSEDALFIQDGTDVQGFFQSENYYASRQSVLDWYRFKKDIVGSAEKFLNQADFPHAVSISLRIDADYAATREYFPLYSIDYYTKALKYYPKGSPIIIFADRPDLAKKFIDNAFEDRETHFIQDATPAQQLFLMTQCGFGNIITNSTFAWWGAYLNKSENTLTCVPAEWVRPGVPKPIAKIIPDSWRQVQSLHPIWDNFQIWRVRHPFSTLKRVFKKLQG